MKATPYSRAALREYRRRKQRGMLPAASTLADIPPEAPMEDGIALGCWNGEAFVSWEKWLTSQPLSAFKAPAKEDAHD
jgi:hypothetical protein